MTTPKPKTLTAFVVEIWCTDCCGEDPQGCFGGGTEFLTTMDGNILYFETKECAESAAEDWLDNLDGVPYEYRVAERKKR